MNTLIKIKIRKNDLKAKYVKIEYCDTIVIYYLVLKFFYKKNKNRLIQFHSTGYNDYINTI